MSRMRTADEVAQLVLFPLSGESGYITDAEVAIDECHAVASSEHGTPVVDRLMRAAFQRLRDLSARAGVPKLADIRLGR